MMKSKNAATRGVRRRSGWGEQAPAACKFRDRAEHTHQVLLIISYRGRQRPDVHAGLHRIEEAQHTVVARRDGGAGRDLGKSLRDAVLAERFAEADRRMS